MCTAERSAFSQPELHFFGREGEKGGGGIWVDTVFLSGTDKQVIAPQLTSDGRLSIELDICSIPC